MTNTKLLRQKIDESGYKLSFIASKLGLTLQGLQRKLDGRTEFKTSEAGVLAELLKLTDQEIKEIFFTPNVE